MRKYFGGSALEPEHPALTESRARGPIAIPRSKRRLSAEQLSALSSSFEEMEKLCESPIEHQFGMAAAAALLGSGLRIASQYQLFGYRYDFAILHPRLNQVLALVECDGREFHSTPEQLANDRKKDAAAKSIGAFVVRYSGSAITRNAKDCAENLLGILHKQWRIL
jgi:very-short-patch-repair endonuclease